MEAPCNVHLTIIIVIIDMFNVALIMSVIARSTRNASKNEKKTMMVFLLASAKNIKGTFNTAKANMHNV